MFEGGFLGLDNIGVFDRSNMPKGMVLDQADGTAWMAMYCLNMLSIAMELARANRAYEDICSKFLEHFISIAHSINGAESTHHGRTRHGLWDDDTKFYYDVLRPAGGSDKPQDARFVRAKSFVGLIPLFAVTTIDEELLRKLPNFKRRMDWFVKHRSDLIGPLLTIIDPRARGRGSGSKSERGSTKRSLLSLVPPERLRHVLHRMLDEDQFLSPYGLRSLSREHKAKPYFFRHGDVEASLQYEAAESSSPMYGGNSNWRAT